jgi:hypothetical protein
MTSREVVKLELTPSDYPRRNFLVSISGIENPDVLDVCIRNLGEDNIFCHLHDEVAGRSP